TRLSGCCLLYLSCDMRRVEETVWLTKRTYTGLVDLRTQSEFSGRFQYQCKYKTCTLTIRDLRETDSAQYQFRFITNQQSRHYTGSPGVTLTVTDLQVKLSLSSYSSWLDCHSRCYQPDRLYVWYKNGQKTSQEQSYYYYYYYTSSFNSADSYSCAVATYEHLPSPSVLRLYYAPKLLSVSVSPSAEIVEGSSVTLTCSSDANPAANYTWYKKHGNPSLQPASKQFNFRSIQSSDSGEYYCTAENDLGRRTSGSIFINVTCESNSFFRKQHTANNRLYSHIFIFNVVKTRNQFSNYTWYKENQTLIHGPEGTYQFTSISSEDRGTYYCRSENQLGQSNSSSVSIDVQCEY
uniref:B-cell receptor CD22 n=1 Tax=Mastacembelus armatus TaxID=205130 RepID=A0A3Q3L6H6_9TELE